MKPQKIWNYNLNRTAEKQRKIFDRDTRNRNIETQTWNFDYTYTELTDGLESAKTVFGDEWYKAKKDKD